MLLEIIIFIFLWILIILGVFIYQGYNLYKDAISEISITEKIEEIKKEEFYIKLYKHLHKSGIFSNFAA